MNFDWTQYYWKYDAYKKAYIMVGIIHAPDSYRSYMHWDNCRNFPVHSNGISITYAVEWDILPDIGHMYEYSKD